SRPPCYFVFRVSSPKALRCILALAMVTSPVACEWLFPMRVTDDADAGLPPDGGAEGGGVDAGADGGGGGHARRPSPPVESSGTDQAGFVVAVQSVALADAGPQAGFDLDGVCTCAPDGPSCRSSAQHCDRPGGRDLEGNTPLALLDGYFS